MTGSAPGPARRPGPRLPGLRAGVAGWLALLDGPLAAWYLTGGITALLAGLGLLMVGSAGSVADLAAGLPPWTSLEEQFLGVLAGLPVLLLASRCPPRLYRAAARPLLAAAAAGLALTMVPGVGVSAGGAARWIALGPVQAQPSELAKLALALWGADLLARREAAGRLGDWRQALVPLLPGAGLLCLLVLAGDDLGTTFILLVIVLALLWVAGTPGRVFAAILALLAFALALMIVTAGYRSQRLTGFIHPSGGPLGPDMQAIQGKWALGSGGLLGTGLGAGRGKWGWVPESTSDFIFAVLGEELGLAGTLCVLALYGGLAFAGLRVARRAPDAFTRLAAAAVTTWIVTQALVNIGAVIGLLPITGVPLPLVSKGLSSLLVTMAALGMLLSFARREPGAAAALAARGPVLRRLARRARPGRRTPGRPGP